MPRPLSVEAMVILDTILEFVWKELTKTELNQGPGGELSVVNSNKVCGCFPCICLFLSSLSTKVVMNTPRQGFSAHWRRVVTDCTYISMWFVSIVFLARNNSILTYSDGTIALRTSLSQRSRLLHGYFHFLLIHRVNSLNVPKTGSHRHSSVSTKNSSHSVNLLLQ